MKVANIHGDFEGFDNSYDEIKTSSRELRNKKHNCISFKKVKKSRPYSICIEYKTVYSERLTESFPI